MVNTFSNGIGLCKQKSIIIYNAESLKSVQFLNQENRKIDNQNFKLRLKEDNSNVPNHLILKGFCFGFYMQNNTLGVINNFSFK